MGQACGRLSALPVVSLSGGFCTNCRKCYRNESHIKRVIHNVPLSTTMRGVSGSVWRSREVSALFSPPHILFNSSRVISESLYSKWVQILRNSYRNGVKIKVLLTAIPGSRLTQKRKFKLSSCKLFRVDHGNWNEAHILPKIHRSNIKARINVIMSPKVAVVVLLMLWQ